MTPASASSPIRIDIWSDFVCPYCYIVTFPLKQLQQSHAVDIHWRAFELRPAGSPPMDPAYLKKIETESRPRVHQMMREQHGITINEGPFGILSRAALVADKYAYAQDRALGDAFHEAVTRAYWVEAQDISQIEVLRTVGASVGLDADALEAATTDSNFIIDVEADIQQATNFGLSGVPALVFDGRYLVSGAQPYELLVQVADQVMEESKRSAE